MSAHCDVLVIGSGIAGLSVALAASRARHVVVASQGSIAVDGASTWAQGGIAAAIGPQDHWELHAQDTLSAGANTNRPEAVARLVQGAGAAIERLQRFGLEFDGHPHPEFGREAAHSRARILHAGGDATGAHVMRTLARAALGSSIDLRPETSVLALIGGRSRVCGAWLNGPEGPYPMFAREVVLATGGIGGLYRYSTNPAGAQGIGLALAMEAGARLSDLEFVQFHPTALAPLPGQRGHLPLVTEALRGAGARLINQRGERFMPALHPDAELAPRDVVARAVWTQLQQGDTVMLDARDAVGPRFRDKFPTVHAACMQRGIDPSANAIPVVPAEHFHMGGISVDAHGRSSVAGLRAVGEVACTGVHGANRLASNSLLEGLVFGHAIGEMLADSLDAPLQRVPLGDAPSADDIPADLGTQLADLAWDELGLVRSGPGLERVLETCNRMRPAHPGALALSRRLLLMREIAQAALARSQSLGAHWRCDPEPGRLRARA